MLTRQRADRGRIRKGEYRDARELPGCVRFARCVCGKILMIERIPDVLGSVWDVFCICGRRYPIPKGYEHDGYTL